MRHVHRSSIVLSCACVISLASACARTVDCASLGDQCGADGTDGTDGSGTDGGDTMGGGTFEVNRDIDILFVIDNSGSMGEEQAILAANIGSFIDVLENDEVEANYRIGVTTTDMGNPWCPSGSTTPEAGKLVLSSCKTRLADFLFSDDVDVQDLACNDICTLDESELEILPTTTDFDPVAKPRPWIERIAQQTNLPSTTDMAEAFACFGPQGVNGCGFESPLEAMYFALLRAVSSTEENYGFIRDNALLAVIFLTDEVDCSHNPDWSAIFDEDGNRAFWSDPAADFPTSAVCWNAGVQCQGDPSNYDSCDPINKGVNGAAGVSDDEAVLYPVSRYINLLQDIEDSKQALNPEQEVIVALIGGVDDSGQAFYADSLVDPEFQNTFGIGPGCEVPNPLDPNEPIRAIPPVRLREVTNAFTPGNMFSICAPDYSPALEEVVSRFRTQIQPACFTFCVADSDPATELVDAECMLSQVPGGPIAECMRDANGYVVDPETDDYMMPAENVNVCYALRTDKFELSEDPLDDMALECVDANYNLEFVIERRPGFPAVSGVTLTAECELANSPELTCPGIGG
jgi:hypothetical protein